MKNLNKKDLKGVIGGDEHPSEGPPETPEEFMSAIDAINESLGDDAFKNLGDFVSTMRHDAKNGGAFWAPIGGFLNIATFDEAFSLIRKFKLVKYVGDAAKD